MAVGLELSAGKGKIRTGSRQTDVEQVQVGKHVNGQTSIPIGYTNSRDLDTLKVWGWLGVLCLSFR